MVWFVVVIVVGVIAALGTNTPLYDLLYQLPGSTLFRVPARAWFMIAFAMAALAGFGVQGLIEWNGRPRPRSLLLATTACVFAILFGVLGGAMTDSISLWTLAIFVPLTVLLIVLRLQQRLTPDRFVAGNRGAVDHRSTDARLGALSSDRFGRSLCGWLANRRRG